MQLFSTPVCFPSHPLSAITSPSTHSLTNHPFSSVFLACCRYIALCKLDAPFVLVGLPEDELSFKPFLLTGNRPLITGSSIGSTKEIKEMLEFASKNDVRPWIELLPMSQVNEGIRKVNENDVKFRVVLEQGK